MNPADSFGGLVDDLGRPINWKFTTWIALAALALTIAAVIATAGARGERLEALRIHMDKLEAKAVAIDRLEARQDEMIRRMDSMEKKVDMLLDRRSR